MPDLIAVKIQTGKIDKSKLFRSDKGVTYLDLILIPSSNSQYGDDYMAVQSLPKAERDAGKKGAIIGNARILKSRKSDSKPAPAAASDGAPDDSGSVPF